jgi:hypothetical protein
MVNMNSTAKLTSEIAKQAVHRGPGARNTTCAAFAAVAVVVLSSCGGGGSGSGLSDGTMLSATGQETGPTTKVVHVPGSVTAVVALFPDGRAYYSPNGYNLGGGGATVLAYSGSQQVIDIVALATGIDTLMSNGQVYFSPDGMNLGGGGNTLHATSGNQAVASITQVGDGVNAAYANGGPIYYSPDGLSLSGGGSSVRIYAGGRTLVNTVAVGPGDAVVSLFSDGVAYYSPNDRDIGGGGSTVAAASADAPAITKLVPVGGGVLAQFVGGGVYLSSDGRNLSGGAGSVAVPEWNATITNAPFAPRDSAHGAQFLGVLWVSGGFSNATNSNSCFTTCSYFDLWSSLNADGTSWNSSPSFATASTPDPRDTNPTVNNGVQDTPLPTDFYDSYSAVVVWHNQLTAIGSTVWRSADGVHWQRSNLADGTPVQGPLPAGSRATENSKAFVIGNTLYFLQTDTGDVQSTSDPQAATWTDLGAMTAYTPRCGAAAFLLNGTMFVTGGGACDYSQVYNDVWSSPDGVNWTQSPAPARWSARMWPCIVVDGNNIAWLAGGYAPTDWNDTDGSISRRYGANHADVWYSRDGSEWKQLKADAGSGLIDDGKLEPRHAPTCFVTPGGTEGQLTIIAGTGGPIPNDGDANTLNSIRVLPLPAAAGLP